MVIPNFVSQALRGVPLTVHGSGDQSRCFCHVKDVVPAIVELLTRPASFGKVYNVGSDQEVTMRQLAELVVKKTNSKSEIQLIPYAEAYPAGFEDMQRRMPDIGRIGGLIGWKPKRTLEDILDDVIAEKRESLALAAKAVSQQSA
jgi:UDP-glucose 4-epimerase